MYITYPKLKKVESGSCSLMSNSVTPWTVAHQAPLSMEFSTCVDWGLNPQQGCRVHSYCYASFSHQAAGASLNDGDAFRRERYFSKKTFSAKCPLYEPVLQALSICLSSTSTPDHSVLPFLLLILQLISSFFKLP